jgi:hypothetical protein
MRKRAGCGNSRSRFATGDGQRNALEPQRRSKPAPSYFTLQGDHDTIALFQRAFLTVIF